MVNPSKLKALVDVHQDPGMAAISSPQHVEPDGDEDMEDEEEPAEAAPPDGNALIASWGKLGEALTEEKGEVVDQAHEVGPSLLLAKIPEDAIEDAQKQFDRMPEELQHCFAKYIAKLTPEQVQAVAAALIDGHDGDTEDADHKLLAVYLTEVGKYAAEEIDPEDIEDEEEEDDDDEDEEGDEEETAAAAPPAPPTGEPPVQA